MGNGKELEGSKERNRPAADSVRDRDCFEKSGGGGTRCKKGSRGKKGEASRRTGAEISEKKWKNHDLPTESSERLAPEGNVKVDRQHRLNFGQTEPARRIDTGRASKAKGSETVKKG